MDYNKTIRIKAVNIDFELTCGACPEQYDVYIEGVQHGYVRLRWGGLRCDYPDVGGETIYQYSFDEGFQGCFDDDEQRDFHLELIAKSIYNRFIGSEGNQNEESISP